MQSNNKKKICIVVSSLGKGGAERSSAIISKMLADLGYDVHVVSVLNDIDYDYGGKLLNLGELKDKNDTFLGRLNRFKVVKDYFKNENFDLIIDSRSRPTIFKEILINKFLYQNYKVVYLVHSWHLENYFSKSKRLSKIVYSKSQAIISVSNDVAESIKKKYKLKNVKTIYNAVDIEKNNLDAANEIDLKCNYILYYGRLDDSVKNISLLIESYKKSILPSKKIKLLILGSGRDYNLLVEKANNKNIIFNPFHKNPFPYIKNAKFCCLTSRYEGFPLVIIESLSVGTPMISVDCQSGPKEVISHRQNGLLVKNNDAQALAEAMNNFIFDESLYLKCRENARESVNKFSVDIISKEWKKLIENII